MLREADVKSYLRRVYRHNSLRAVISAVAFWPWTLGPPQHLYSFSPKSLILLAEQVGVDYAVTDHYRIPLWEYALMRHLVHIPRRAQAAARWCIAVAISPFEIASKFVKAVLQAENLVTPGGLIIRIERH